MIANSSFEGVAKFKYLGKTLTDEDCKNEEIKSRLNSGKLVTTQFSLLSSRLLSKKYKG
jgi:hypothetical protein